MKLARTKIAELLAELRDLSPDDRVVRLRLVDSSGEVLLDLADEASRLTTKSADEAIEATQMIQEMADQIDSSLARARSRRAHARALSYAGQFERALSVCNEAVEIAGGSGEDAEAARARLASMHALTELGRLDAALLEGEVARRTFEDLGEVDLVARADINLGIVHQKRDEPARAIECFQRARSPLASEPLILGHIDNNRGEALVALNDFRGAEAAFQAALAAYEKAEAPLTAAIADGNLADMAARQEHLQRALFHFERARRRFETNTSPTHLARLVAEQAEAKAILGMPSEALSEYEAALPDLDACGLALEAARARSGMGMVLLRQGKLSEAETALAAAAVTLEELGHATARAKVDLVRAELFILNNRLDDARTLVHRAMAVLADRPADSVTGRLLLARLAERSGNTELAARELDTAITIARDLDLPPPLADLLHSRGRLHHARHELNLAVSDLEAAVEAIERTRGTLQAERLRSAWLGDRAKIYEHLVEALLDRGDDESVAEAFETTEKAKSRALLDQMNAVLALGADEPIVEGVDPSAISLLARLEQLQAELNGLYSRFADVDLPAQQRAEVQTLHADIRQREDELDSIRGRLSITSGAMGLMAPTVTLDAVVEQMVGEQRLVEYMAIENELFAFVISADGVEVHRHLARLDEVTRHLTMLRFQLDRALRPGAMDSPRFSRMIEDTRRELAALYELIVDPVIDAIEDADQLTIIPHGPLHLVPFHALWDGEQYLVERFSIHYAPSSSILEQLGMAKTTSRSDSALVVGVADDAAPDIADEARAVASTIGPERATLLLDRVATAEKVCKAAEKAEIVHLACHGRFVPDSPMSSGLRLGDRWLTVRDIYGMQLPAELVVLSGCETGLNDVMAGDELIGLLRGFFAAGARSMLVSLWRAYDESTSLFMSGFYDQWRLADARRLGWAVMLRTVQLDIMQQWPHPAYWAPFVLVGRR